MFPGGPIPGRHGPRPSGLSFWKSPVPTCCATGLRRRKTSFCLRLAKPQACDTPAQAFVERRFTRAAVEGGAGCRYRGKGSHHVIAFAPARQDCVVAFEGLLVFHDQRSRCGWSEVHALGERPALQVERCSPVNLDVSRFRLVIDALQIAVPALLQNGRRRVVRVDLRKYDRVRVSGAQHFLL